MYVNTCIFLWWIGCVLLFIFGIYAKCILLQRGGVPWLAEDISTDYRFVRLSCTQANDQLFLKTDREWVYRALRMSPFLQVKDTMQPLLIFDILPCGILLNKTRQTKFKYHDLLKILSSRWIILPDVTNKIKGLISDRHSKVSSCNSLIHILFVNINVCVAFLSLLKITELTLLEWVTRTSYVSMSWWCVLCNRPILLATSVICAYHQ